MTVAASLYHHFKRYRTLQTNHIRTLPIVILMPHSACNCQCVMCDIWKDNKNLKQLTEKDIEGLLVSLKSLGTQQVLMSGGEAMLNPNFFRFCELLKQHDIKVSVLSTGLTLKRNAEQILLSVNDIIVSLDGDEATHDRIRNIPQAFKKLKEGVEHIKSIDPDFPITARTVIHRLNFRQWPAIIEAAKEMGLDQISFLPADVSSHAFNREQLWSEDRQHEIIPGENELDELRTIMESVITANATANFIAENPEKLRKIHGHYAAFYGQNPFPYKKCNAPWVSTVVEADGTVRPCFFHPPIGNIREQSLEKILNSDAAIRFRKDLDMDSNSTCVKCVCYLNLSPRTKLN
ncbi:MAG TPA: radical SAM protein [Chitinophagaceae bacterium]|jgi:MoaA/NifB/PqqE/SkfB family radical SAM enzyme|nr:radical SAM protein [Chitinophagaceae bacterium]